MAPELSALSRSTLNWVRHPSNLRMPDPQADLVDPIAVQAAGLEEVDVGEHGVARHVPAERLRDLISQLSVVVRPVLLSPWNVNPCRPLAVALISTPFQRLVCRSAMRSFTPQPGLKLSSLSSTIPGNPSDYRSSATSGVRPMASTTEEHTPGSVWLFTRATLE